MLAGTLVTRVSCAWICAWRHEYAQHPAPCAPGIQGRIGPTVGNVSLTISTLVCGRVANPECCKVHRLGTSIGTQSARTQPEMRCMSSLRRRLCMLHLLLLLLLLLLMLLLLLLLRRRKLLLPRRVHVLLLLLLLLLLYVLLLLLLRLRLRMRLLQLLLQRQHVLVLRIAFVR